MRRRVTFEQREEERSAQKQAALDDMTQPGTMLGMGILVWIVSKLIDMLSTPRGCLAVIGILIVLVFIALLIAGPGAF